MTFLILAALSLFGVAIAALVWGVVLPRNRADARVGEIDAYGYAAAHAPAAVARAETSTVRAFAQRLGELLGARLGTEGDSKAKRELLAAGVYNLTPRALAGYQVLAACGGAAFGVLLDPFPGLAGPLVDSAGLAALGWLVPITLVRRRGRLRLVQVDRALPDVIDLIVVSVEAGQGFAQALDTAARRAHGALGEELRLTLQEQRFGLPMDRALENLLARAETVNVRTFVRAVVQGERLGVSIGQIMRNVADEMRLRRRQTAEERAQKTTVKILFPLVFCILPALFVVLLVPPLMDLGKYFG